MTTLQEQDRDRWLFMSEARALGPTNHEEFEALHPAQRAQIARQVAVGEIKELAESSGVPWRLDEIDTLGVDEAIAFARSLRFDAPASPLAALHESGIPTKEAPPMPSHALVSALDDAVPAGHADRQAVDRLHAQGAALTAGERDEVARLAAKHGLIEPAASGETGTACPSCDGSGVDGGEVCGTCDGGGTAMSESSVALLHEAGIPVVGGVPEFERREMTPLASLIDSGVPLKGAAGSAEPNWALR